MSKILVLYYSRTGRTQAIACQIALACSADVESIEDVTGRRHASGYVRSGIEAALHLNTPIRPARHVPSDYDIVVVGTPVWLRNVASPVRSYLKRYRPHIRRVAFFCSYGDSGYAKVLGDLESLCGRPALATLAIANADIAGTLYSDRLSKFTAALQGTGRSPARPGWSERIHENTPVGL